MKIPQTLKKILAALLIAGGMAGAGLAVSKGHPELAPAIQSASQELVRQLMGTPVPTPEKEK